MHYRIHNQESQELRENYPDCLLILDLIASKGGEAMIFSAKEAGLSRDDFGEALRHLKSQGMVSTRSEGLALIATLAEQSIVEIPPAPEEVPTASKFTAQAQEVYSLYPLKKGKLNAIRYIARDLKDGIIGFEDLKARVRSFAALFAEGVEEIAYCKHASTYFNQRCWDDEDNSEPSAPPKAGEVGYTPNLKGYSNKEGY
tara:strand:+ start:1864 stop:2463 length:600 start_codon:yes stop_codon:yes gene_type:complete